MDRKEAERNLRSAPTTDPDEKVGREYFDRKRGNSFYTRNYTEDNLIEAIDSKDVIEEHAEWITKLKKGQIDVPQFLTGLAPHAAVQLLSAVCGGEMSKTQLEAVKDMLDRAGFGKVNKHAIASVDPNQPREQLLAMLEGMNKKNPILEIED